MASDATPARPARRLRPGLAAGILVQSAASVTGAALGALALGHGFWVSGAVLLAGALVLAVHLGRHRSPAPVPASEPSARGWPEPADARHGGDIIVRLTADNGLVCETEAARTLFGVSGDIQPAPEALGRALRAVAVGTPGGCTVVTVALNGVDRHFGILRPQPSDPLRVQLLDLTGLLIAQRASAVQDFLTISSHELMNGLTPLVSLSQTARDQIADGEAGEALATLDTMGSAARRMLLLLEAFRAMARLPRPQPRPLRLGPLLDEMMVLARARWSSVTVTLLVGPDVAASLVQLDRDLIVQAIANLINNAAEAALSQPRDPASPPAVTLRAQVSGGHLSLTVTDNGPGIPPDLAAHVFRPFFTTRDRGSGVGLPLAAQIASTHGGWLRLLPEPPTAFVITVPDCVLSAGERSPPLSPGQPEQPVSADPEPGQEAGQGVGQEVRLGPGQRQALPG